MNLGGLGVGLGGEEGRGIEGMFRRGMGAEAEASREWRMRGLAYRMRLL